MADEKINWTEKDAWIGYFDILGFKNRINHPTDSLDIDILKDQIDALLDSLKPSLNCIQYGLKFMVFADTIIIYAPTQEPRPYVWFMKQCNRLICKSITVKLPLRGSISTGKILLSEFPPIIIGQAAMEAHDYCERQNWIGLIMAPSVECAMKQFDLCPTNFGFVRYKIPTKKQDVIEAFAYSFQNRNLNSESTFMHFLDQMKHGAADCDKEKYDNTIKFIEENYK